MSAFADRMKAAREKVVQKKGVVAAKLRLARHKLGDVRERDVEDDSEREAKVPLLTSDSGEQMSRSSCAAAMAVTAAAVQREPDESRAYPAPLATVAHGPVDDRCA
jgi:hypothetical protein